MYTFKIAQEEDKPWIMSLCSSFYNFSEYSKRNALDLSCVERTIDWYLSTPENESIIILMEYNGVPVGMISLISTPMPFWNGFIAAEQVWWVDPDHRGKSSLKFIKLAEEWARVTGCVGIALSSLESNNNVSKIYTRSGYTLMESSFYKDLN